MNWARFFGTQILRSFVSGCYPLECRLWLIDYVSRHHLSPSHSRAAALCASLLQIKKQTWTKGVELRDRDPCHCLNDNWIFCPSNSHWRSPFCSPSFETHVTECDHCVHAKGPFNTDTNSALQQGELLEMDCNKKQISAGERIRVPCWHMRRNRTQGWTWSFYKPWIVFHFKWLMCITILQCTEIVENTEGFSIIVYPLLI